MPYPDKRDRAYRTPWATAKAHAEERAQYPDEVLWAEPTTMLPAPSTPPDLGSDAWVEWAVSQPADLGKE